MVKRTQTEVLLTEVLQMCYNSEINVSMLTSQYICFLFIRYLVFDMQEILLDCMIFNPKSDRFILS